MPCEMNGERETDRHGSFIDKKRQELSERGGEGERQRERRMLMGG